MRNQQTSHGIVKYSLGRQAYQNAIACLNMEKKPAPKGIQGWAVVTGGDSSAVIREPGT